MKLDLLSELEAEALSANTRIAYKKGWDLYLRFRTEARLKGDPLDIDEEKACEFLVWLCAPCGGGPALHPRSAMLYRQGVARAIREGGGANPFESVRAQAVAKGLLRRYGGPPRRVKALLAEDVVKMVELCRRETVRGVRDAAILALGFSCALRRSEICNLERPDVTIHDDFSMTVLIRRSKTDKENIGQKVSVPPGQHLRPGVLVSRWLAVSKITEGPLFQTLSRGGRLRGRPMHYSDIPRLVKHYAGLAGHDPKEVAGHSLRAGFVTSAARSGARLEKIMEVTRHVQLGTLLKYIREENQLSDHAGEASYEEQHRNTDARTADSRVLPERERPECPG